MPPSETVMETTARRLPTVILSTILACLIAGMAAMVGWGLAIDRRVTTMEVRQEGIKEDITEMKADLKLILMEVRK